MLVSKRSLNLCAEQECYFEVTTLNRSVAQNKSDTCSTSAASYSVGAGTVNVTTNYTNYDSTVVGNLRYSSFPNVPTNWRIMLLLLASNLFAFSRLLLVQMAAKN
jgi:heterodisulfide reductase subunit A-like polyferredoxin